MAMRTAYGAGSGVHDAAMNSCIAMRHRIAAAMGWSRFETVRAAARTISSTPQRVYEPLTQASGRPLERDQ